MKGIERNSSSYYRNLQNICATATFPTYGQSTVYLCCRGAVHVHTYIHTQAHTGYTESVVEMMTLQSLFVYSDMFVWISG